MAGQWKPKFRAICQKCGWTGVRARVTAFCPKGCGSRCTKDDPASRQKDQPHEG